MSNYSADGRLTGSETFLGRAYNAGSGDAQPVECSFEGNSMHVVYSNQEFQPFSTSLDAFDITIGGSDSDKIVFNHQASGTRILFSDTSIIPHLGFRSAQLQKQLGGIKVQRMFGGFAGHMMTWALPLGFIIFVVGFWIFVRVASHSQHPEPVTAPPTTEVAAPEQDRVALLEAYGDKMALSLDRNWTPPPKLKKTLEAEVNILVGARGQIAQVEFSHSSGNKHFDKSIDRAAALLKKMETGTPDQMNRGFNFKFRVESGRKSVTQIITSANPPAQQEEPQQ